MLNTKYAKQNTNNRNQLFIFVLHFFICFFFYYYYCYIPLPVYLPAEMIALRDHQITIERCKIVLRAPTRLGAKVAIKCNTVYFGLVVWCTQSKQLSTNFLAAVDLGRCNGDCMPRKKITDSWYSTIEYVNSWRCKLDALCKQRQTLTA